MLIPSYRRQATVLKLAHSHAIMHANRLFLLGGSYENNVNDCIAAAKVVLETVDASAKEGPIFHAFWWTHYVTFNALVVVYVWETQRQNHQSPDREKLLQLAQKCHTHLAEATATNSPSRRYAVILEEFRDAATRAHQSTGILDAPTLVDPNFLDQWDTSDWLDLDSSVCLPLRPCDYTNCLGVLAARLYRFPDMARVCMITLALTTHAAVSGFTLCPIIPDDVVSFTLCVSQL
jgi:hypothetical protein